MHSGEFLPAAAEEADTEAERHHFLHKTLILSRLEQVGGGIIKGREMQDGGKGAKREMWVIFKCCRLRHLWQPAAVDRRLQPLSACCGVRISTDVGRCAHVPMQNRREGSDG